LQDLHLFLGIVGSSCLSKSFGYGSRQQKFGGKYNNMSKMLKAKINKVTTFEKHLNSDNLRTPSIY
jgi:hypothetical protein